MSLDDKVSREVMNRLLRNIEQDTVRQRHAMEDIAYAEQQLAEAESELAAAEAMPSKTELDMLRKSMYLGLAEKKVRTLKKECIALHRRQAMNKAAASRHLLPAEQQLAEAESELAAAEAMPSKTELDMLRKSMYLGLAEKKVRTLKKECIALHRRQAMNKAAASRHLLPAEQLKHAQRQVAVAKAMPFETPDEKAAKAVALIEAENEETAARKVCVAAYRASFTRRRGAIDKLEAAFADEDEGEDEDEDEDGGSKAAGTAGAGTGAGAGAGEGASGAGVGAGAGAAVGRVKRYPALEAAVIRESGGTLVLDVGTVGATGRGIGKGRALRAAAGIKAATVMVIQKTVGSTMRAASAPKEFPTPSLLEKVLQVAKAGSDEDVAELFELLAPWGGDKQSVVEEEGALSKLYPMIKRIGTDKLHALCCQLKHVRHVHPVLAAHERSEKDEDARSVYVGWESAPSGVDEPGLAIEKTPVLHDFVATVPCLANHACPGAETLNTHLQPVMLDGVPALALVALRDIKNGEEVCVSYAGMASSKELAQIPFHCTCESKWCISVPRLEDFDGRSKEFFEREKQICAARAALLADPRVRPSVQRVLARVFDEAAVQSILGLSAEGSWEMGDAKSRAQLFITRTLAHEALSMFPLVSLKPAAEKAASAGHK